MMGKKGCWIRATWVEVISLTNVQCFLLHSGTVGVYSFISSVSPTREEKNKKDWQKDVEGTEAVITADRRCTSRVQIRAGGGGGRKKIQVNLSGRTTAAFGTRQYHTVNKIVSVLFNHSKLILFFLKSTKRAFRLFYLLLLVQ